MRNDSVDKPPKTARNTPVPFQKPPRKPKDTSESDSEHEKRPSNPRSTPLPFRGSSPQKPLRKPIRDSESDSESDRRTNPSIRSQTPLSFRGCSPQAAQRRFSSSKDSSSDSEHEKRNQTNPRNTPLPFRGCSPQASGRRGRDMEFDHMEGARRSTSAPRSTPLPYWSCYSPYPYPLPYPDCDWEVEQIKNNSEDPKTNPRNTPLPFWGCYSPFYPIPYQNESSDMDIEQSRSSLEEEDPNSAGYPYWDPYGYPPYYYGYPPMYPYPIYPSVPCDSEESMNYSSTDEMALYNQRFNQNPDVEVEQETEEATDDSTPTPEKCQNFEEIRNIFEGKFKVSESNQSPIDTSEKRKQISEDVGTVSEEKCNNFQELRKAFEDNCYVEDNKNFLNQHLNEKPKKLEEQPVITKDNLIKHNQQYSEVESETETETETETNVNSSDSEYSDTETEVEEEHHQTDKYANSYGNLQAIRSVSDINVYSVDESNCTDDDEDNVSVATTTTEENDDESSVCNEDETIPHQLSTIYEESERSYCSRMGRHSRESSVSTTVSVETVANERESDRDSDETCVNGTIYVNENDGLTAEIEVVNNDNERIDVDTTFTIVQKTEAQPSLLESPLDEEDDASSSTPFNVRSRSASIVYSKETTPKIEDQVYVESPSEPKEVETDDIYEDTLGYEKEIEAITDVLNEDKDEYVNTTETIENHANYSNVDESQNQVDDDDDGPDWWSEINKDRDDDIIPCRPKSIFHRRDDPYEYEDVVTPTIQNDNYQTEDDTNYQDEEPIIEEAQSQVSDEAELESHIQNEESSLEELKVADETCTKETQKYAIIHNEDVTKFVSESHSDTTHAVITEGENGTTTTTVTNCKLNSFDNEMLLNENTTLAKEEFVNGVIKSSRIEKAIVQDVSEVAKDRITNNYIKENQEEVNQAYMIETKNGDVINEKINENCYTRSGRSVTTMNDNTQDTVASTDLVQQNSQEIIFNEEGSTKHSLKELEGQEMLCSGIVQSTNALIENLESFNKLSKQYILANNQLKTEEIKQNVASNKVVECKSQDNMYERKEKEETIKKESNKSVIETEDGVTEIRRKKITKKSKHYSIVSSSECDSDLENHMIKSKHQKNKESKKVKGEKRSDNNNSKAESENKIDYTVKELKPKNIEHVIVEIKNAHQEIISDDFETCGDCSTDSDPAQNVVCSQEPMPQHHEQESKQEINQQIAEEDVKMPSIKERIEALQKASQGKNKTTEEIVDIKDKTSNIEDSPVQVETLQTESAKTNRSLEDVSEDDIDSGVTSDISRHLSDNESDFPELNKMTRYQRASTHSRLFKLLQEGCENEDGEGEVVEEQTVIVNNVIEDQQTKETMQSRRESLTLPLKNYSESDSFSSSGINSPGSPVVSERLVNELVQSLLRRKKGQIFRGMSMDKLHAAALRILQEELEGAQVSPPSTYLSPLRSSTVDSTPAQTPQEFYSNYPDYTQYYDSWADAHLPYENNFDVIPSRAFWMAQDNALGNKPGGVSGYWARCPRVLSGKNKDPLYLSDNRHNQSPEHSLETNGATSAS